MELPSGKQGCLYPRLEGGCDRLVDGRWAGPTRPPVSWASTLNPFMFLITWRTLRPCRPSSRRNSLL
jgi:hypothetical protein